MLIYHFLKGVQYKEIIENKTAGSMDNSKENIKSVLDKKITARYHFDGKFEVFVWEGGFEGFEVIFKSWMSYNYIDFCKDDYTLGIKYTKYEEKDIKNHLLYLPTEVKLNSHYYHRCNLEIDQEEYKALIDILKGFFEDGKSIDYSIFSSKTKEVLEVMVFGYFTYKRFLSFVENHFPDFYDKMSHYGGKPVSEILEVFKSTNLSKKELELELKKAVLEEDFEKASFLRDKIKSLKG